MKCAIKFTKFDLVFKARTSIKGQTVKDFIAEVTNAPEVEETMEPTEPSTWNVFVDGSSSEVGV